MNIRELTNNVVNPRMEIVYQNPGDTFLVENLMREAVNAAVTQNLIDVNNGEDVFFDLLEELLEALEAIVSQYPLIHGKPVPAWIRNGQIVIAKAKGERND